MRRHNIAPYLLIILLLFPLLALPASAEVLLKFVQVSDVHLAFPQQSSSRRMLKESKSLFTDAIRQINGLNNVDFVVFTGDMTNSPSLSDTKEFIKIANTLKADWYPVLGNHDVLVAPSSKKNELVNLFKASSKGMQNNKPYYTIYPTPQTALVVIDPTIDTRITANGELPFQQFAWLKQVLENNKNRQIVIASHFPIIEPFGSHSHKILSPSDQETLRLINRYPNVIMVVSGHYHSTKIKQVENKLHVSTPSLVEYPNAFRVIEVHDDGKVTFQWMETSLKNVQATSKSRSKWAATAYGQARDREGVYQLQK